MDDNRLAYLRALVLARCPEIDAADLALMAQADISAEIMEALLDVLDQMEMKLAGIERGLAPARTH